MRRIASFGSSRIGGLRRFVRDDVERRVTRRSRRFGIS